MLVQQVFVLIHFNSLSNAVLVGDRGLIAKEHMLTVKRIHVGDVANLKQV